MVKTETVYSRFACAKQHADSLSAASSHLYDLWHDTDGAEIPGAKAAAAKEEWERLVLAGADAARTADTLRADHLKPFQAVCEAVRDDAYHKGKNVGKYKQARQRLWNEETKFNNALLVAAGLKPIKLDRSFYHIDFQ